MVKLKEEELGEWVVFNAKTLLRKKLTGEMYTHQ
jgi:hypothetical protein